MSLVIILIREIFSTMHDMFVSVLCIQELGLINVDKDAVISSDKALSVVTHFNLFDYKLQLWEEMSSLSYIWTKFIPQILWCPSACVYLIIYTLKPSDFFLLLPYLCTSTSISTQHKLNITPYRTLILLYMKHFGT